jgi:hypothetical protein
VRFVMLEVVSFDKSLLKGEALRFQQIYPSSLM